MDGVRIRKWGILVPKATLDIDGKPQLLQDAVPRILFEAGCSKERLKSLSLREKAETINRALQPLVSGLAAVSIRGPTEIAKAESCIRELLRTSQVGLSARLGNSLPPAWLHLELPGSTRETFRS